RARRAGEDEAGLRARGQDALEAAAEAAQVLDELGRRGVGRVGRECLDEDLERLAVVGREVHGEAALLDGALLPRSRRATLAGTEARRPALEGLLDEPADARLLPALRRLRGLERALDVEERSQVAVSAPRGLGARRVDDAE